MIPQPITDPNDPNDAWALTTTGYALDKFYMRASDSKGHSQAIQVRMSPNMQAQVMAMVADADLPYRSPADLIRDAMTHRIRWVIEQQKAMAGTPNAALWRASEEDILHEKLLADRERSERRRAMIADLWQDVQRLVSENRTNLARDFIGEFESIVETWDDVDERKLGYHEVDRLEEYLSSGGRVASLAARRVSA